MACMERRESEGMVYAWELAMTVNPGVEGIRTSILALASKTPADSESTTGTDSCAKLNRVGTR